jgi:hypothetical protein
MLIIASCLQAAGGSLERSDLTGTRPLVITSDMSKSLIGAVPDPRAVQPHLQNSIHRFSSLFESFFFFQKNMYGTRLLSEKQEFYTLEEEQLTIPEISNDRDTNPARLHTSAIDQSELS